MFNFKRVIAIWKDDFNTVLICCAVIGLLFSFIIFTNDYKTDFEAGFYGDDTELNNIEELKKYDDRETALTDLKDNSISALFDSENNQILVNKNFQDFQSLEQYIKKNKDYVENVNYNNIIKINKLVIFLAIYYIIMTFLIAPILLLREKTYGVDKYIFYTKLTSFEYLISKFFGILIPCVIFPITISLILDININNILYYIFISFVSALFITSLSAIITLKFRSSNSYLLFSTVLTTIFMIGLLIVIENKLLLHNTPIVSEYSRYLLFQDKNFIRLLSYVFVSLVLILIYSKNYIKDEGK